MLYVESVTYFLLINEEQVGYIKPERGLRQGNPLSPYLFIVCTEGLIALLKGAISRGELNVSKAQVIGNLLSTYELWSGQLVNVHKSTILFSPNVPVQTRNEISRVLGMPQVSTHGKYLGLPTSIGSFKKEVFHSIVDRVKTKVDKWKSRLLSKTGKEVFIMSVLQSIPMFTMQCFRIPIQICKKIDSILANYWWGLGTNKKIHLMAWEQLCKSKEKWDLGFRRTQDFNQALLCKKAWRLMTEPNCQLSTPAIILMVTSSQRN
ncbi:hypothetical protein LIER_33013 [Lithospermum erythrorhizon]|uniref:Reverse transcriptase n=1 Tax=Lithospermum erythrorhizon TaxID=34254 RepID=A0AAV3RXZ7_LITER